MARTQTSRCSHPSAHIDAVNNRVEAGLFGAPHGTFAPDSSQAAPIAGSWFGEAADYLGMTVKVVVHRR